MNERTSRTSRLRYDRPGVIPVWVIVLLLGPISAGENDPNAQAIVQNPHRDSASCISCHTSTAGGREALRYNGNISQLCESCHDGRLAAREAHAVNLVPSVTMAQRIPPDFPLEHRMLTCLSCHDVARDCKAGQSAATSNHNFLRGARVSDPLVFCFHCHAPENYRPFNAHDQLEAGKPKADACGWCHVRVPEPNSPPREDASYELRTKSATVCRNCHAVAQEHPVVSHIHAIPPAEMMWYMSAHEMQPKMRLPLEQLLEYARASRRHPRSIPLDEDGRITCYSCHNPHEKGLLPDWSGRSIGAESKQATNHRLRVREGSLCVICHQK